jgi:hypothetical protein
MMPRFLMHALALVVLLMPLFGIAFGIYILAAESIWISAFGLPVKVTGIPKVVFGIVCFLPAVVFGFVIVAIAKRKPPN